MKKKLILLGLILIISPAVSYADVDVAEPVKVEISMNDVTVFSEKNLFGLKDKSDNIIVAPQYKKLIRLGNSSWIIQKKSKYGLIDSSGNILIEPKFRHVDRMIGKYVKFGNDTNFGIYDEKGEILVQPEYTSIDMLFGGMFLVKKNFKYGIADKNGKIILDTIFDDIYMPESHIIRIEYAGQWYEIEQVAGGELELPEDVRSIKENNNFQVTTFVKDPVTASGYSAVTFTDYLLKIFSSISPSHEETIDELMLSQGAETVNIFIKFTWLPKYPFTFAKKYYYTLITPNNGPLSEIKNELKQKIK